jgi:hypothetical protein
MNTSVNGVVTNVPALAFAIVSYVLFFVGFSMHLSLLGLRKPGERPLNPWRERVLNVIFRPEELSDKGLRIRRGSICCYVAAAVMFFIGFLSAFLFAK